MQRRDGHLLFAPTDLAQFMESRFASWMSRHALDHPELKPGRDRSDPEAIPGEAELLKRRGEEHEARVLGALRAEGRDVVEIEVRGADSAARTLDAMRAGRDVIYQAHLESQPFAGMADFLVRVEGRSLLGDFHYEVWDAKLALRPRPAHVIQLCAYADLLEALQGRRPVHVAIVLGNGARARLRTDDFFYFYRALRGDFLACVAAFDPASRPFPDPWAHHGIWEEEVERTLEACDHVSRVATLTRVQTQRLARVGIETLAGLADSRRRRIPGVADEVYLRLREQAALQRDSIGRERPCHRTLREDEIEPGRGLAGLPPASPGDVFLDLEGNPLDESGQGLEYLWGAVAADERGAPIYRDEWAHDARGERRALESFVDGCRERRARHPDMHVYHYAAYEVSALRRLASREATREAELDALLREGVFVDLYAVVRHGIRVGTPSHSLKDVERLYRAPRAGEIASGMESVAYYEAWRASGEPEEWQRSPLLRRIRDYNEEDCRSTFELAAWLRARQREAGITFRPREVMPAPEEEEDAAQAERQARRALARRLLDEIPAAEEERRRDPEHWHVQELLGQLLEFHHREAKPVWWEFHDRREMTEEERAEQANCLAGLRRTSRAPFAIKASVGFEYEFDPEQDTKIAEGDDCAVAQFAQPRPTVHVHAIDDAAGRVELKVSEASLAKHGVVALPARLCLVQFDFVGAREIERAIEAIALDFAARRSLPPALRDLLLRQPPRIRGHVPGPIQRDREEIDAAFLRAVRDLDGSTLCVQGPPGSGKTTKAGQVIAELVRRGRTVGITSLSHAAIVNLMNACAKANGGSIECVKIGGEDDEVPTFPGANHETVSKRAASWLDQVRLIGGTAWCFSRDELRGKLDYLFVDEASQVPLANVVGMSRCARNLVLIGDQMQLSQPTRGAHPGESGRSALDYSLGVGTAGEHAVVPPEKGLFLAETHRLHPEVCGFVSGAFYEDRLQPGAGNEKRVLTPDLEGTGRLSSLGSGIAFVPVRHEGNRLASDEEAGVVRDLFAELRGRRYTDREGKPAGAIEIEDILVVAPYNLQVRKLAAALPDGARVGTVDRFQGKQAPVVIVSMCASEPHLSARGIEFLFHPNRLNVAVSRAQCLAVVVGEPRLATALCRSLEQMRLVNRVCRLLQAGRWV
jgi:uncharacterized protein